MERILYTFKTNKIIRILYYPFAKLRKLWLDHRYPNSEDSRYIKTLKDSHNGERCFVIGNGPSLTPMDLDKLKGEFSFGTNKIYYMFDKTDWRPSTYFAMDTEFITANISIIKKLELQHIYLVYSAKKYYTTNPSNTTFFYIDNPFSIKYTGETTSA